MVLCDPYIRVAFWATSFFPCVLCGTPDCREGVEGVMDRMPAPRYGAPPKALRRVSSFKMSCCGACQVREACDCIRCPVTRHRNEPEDLTAGGGLFCLVICGGGLPNGSSRRCSVGNRSMDYRSVAVGCTRATVKL